MNTPVLNDNLRAATEAPLQSARQGRQGCGLQGKNRSLFPKSGSNQAFEEVNAYGEELRNKHLAGMPPTEEEISKFDALRENVIKNDAARGFWKPARPLTNS